MIREQLHKTLADHAGRTQYANRDFFINVH
jgi:hypothetical protein